MRLPLYTRSVIIIINNSAAATTSTVTTSTASAEFKHVVAVQHLSSNVGGSRSLHSYHRIALGTHHRTVASVASARYKSTHHPTPHLPPSTKSPVLPKPSHIASTLPSEETGVPTAHPQPPPHQGPPRLVRYEQQPQHPLSLYPSAFSHASYPDPVSYRAHLSNRRAPASLFGLFPSTSATAASLQASSDPFAYSQPVSKIQTSLPAPTRASSETATAPSAQSSIMAASTSSIVDAAKTGEAELHQRKKNAAAAASSPSEANSIAAKTSAVLGHHHHHGHGHGHHDHGSAEEADKLLAALKGKGDRGSNITLAGLVSNVGLCGAKGVAGVYLNSAALLADAAHSLSDMFADLVTLFCWKMSQKPPSASHPLGYGKYETMGSLGVSLVLVAGAVGIGFHSYGLLLEALQPTLQHAPAALQAFGQFTGSIASAGGMLHDHHDHAAASSGEGAGLLDPNAMWFALLSIVVKEWLYHATLKIAREENSSVLEANALHHRSDSLSSAVTFLAIGGSYLGFPVLDPLGGLLVAGLIGKQGADLLIGALGELSDRGVEPETLQTFDAAIVGVQKQFPQLLRGWRDLRAVKSGVSVFADVTLQLPNDATLVQAGVVESAVREAITASIKAVKEVRVRLVTVDAV